MQLLVTVLILDISVSAVQHLKRPTLHVVTSRLLLTMADNSWLLLVAYFTPAVLLVCCDDVLMHA